MSAIFNALVKIIFVSGILQFAKKGNGSIVEIRALNYQNSTFARRSIALI